MGVEIERKFLVVGDAWRSLAPGVSIRQGYLSLDPDRTVRVRVAGARAWFTVKGRSTGATRAEYEVPLPVADAVEILERLCIQPAIEKVRHRPVLGSDHWVVDEFSGANQGLVLAEIELDDEDQPFDRPPWLGEEVTDDPRYFNASLVTRPYATWSPPVEG